MGAAILIKGAKRALLQNVVIRGFSRGIVAERSNLFLDRVLVSHSGVGLELKESSAILYGSGFLYNQVDILAERASIELIDTIASTIRAYMSDIHVHHYAINPYKLRILATDVLREKHPERKRRKFKRLLNEIFKYVEYVEHAIALYEIYKILRVILRQLGVSI